MKKIISFKGNFVGFVRVALDENGFAEVYSYNDGDKYRNVVHRYTGKNDGRGGHLVEIVEADHPLITIKDIFESKDAPMGGDVDKLDYRP